MAIEKNLRFALHILNKHRLFSAVAISSLGLAIGANSAVFSIVDAALFRPYDVRQPDRLINVYTTDSTGHGFQSSSYPDFAAMRGGVPGVAGVFGYSGLMTTITGGKPEVVFGEIVSGNYFDVSGARIALGRGFLPEEDRTPGAAPVVVISDRLWHRRFGADSSIVGTSITLNGHPFTVVGIAAPEFTGMLFRGLNTELWAPVMMMGELRTDQLANRQERWMFVKARLAPGATVDDASRGLAVLGGRLAASYPATNHGRTFVARLMSDVLVNPEGDRVIFPGAIVLLVIVGFVVLIAATNVANVMFARASSREREIAVRLALGASRRQTVAQLLAESSVLAVLGGALGLALAYLFARLLVAFQPPIPVPITLHADIDARVVAFTIATTAAATLVFGLLPAWRMSRPALTAALGGASRLLRGRGIMRLRRAFLVPQLTLSLVLLMVAGLFARSVMKAGAVDPGFDIAHTVSLSLNLDLDGYDSTRARTFYDDLGRRLLASPGVQNVTVTDRIPLDLYGNQSASVELADSKGRRTEQTVQTAGIDAGYFRAFGIPIVRGRAITELEVRERRPVAVISEAMARRYWPATDAIGRFIDRPGAAPLEIVGVARDARVQTLGESPQPLVYHAIDGNYARLLRLVVRTSGSPAELVTTVRHEVSALDPSVAIFELGTMASHLDVMLFPYRAAAAVSALLGLFGLLLSSIGLFGVVAFNVARRTRELGIRMALGATRRTILAMVLGEQSRIIALALGLGLVLALGTARVLSSVIFGISWSDPVTVATVIVPLGGVALVASYLPAARAAGLEPSVALRDE